MTRRHTVVPSPIGPLTVVRDGDVLLRLYLEPPTSRADLGPPDEAGCADVTEQLDEYFSGSRERFDLALRPTGTDFDMAVWAELSRIPYGETHTYGSVATAVGEPGAAQAVGLACGRNPLPIVIPCHRVIGADSSLVGFGGGLPRKRFLLDLEQRESRLF